MNMGAPSHEVAEIGIAIQSEIPAPRAVDLGAGDGRNSILLATLGFAVEAVERDPKLLRELEKRIGTTEKLSISSRCTEVQNFRWEEDHELCLLLGILHFLPFEVALQVIEKAKSKAVAGAIHIVTISDPTHGSEEMTNSFPQQGYLGSLETNDILDTYRDWELLAYECYVKIDSHSDGETDEHPISKFVFGKKRNSIGFVIAKPNKISARQDQREIQCFMKGFCLRGTSYLDIMEDIGPPDLDFELELPGRQSTLVEGMTTCRLRACFWGTAKAYFENNVLVGVGFYKGDSHWRFVSATA